MDGRFLYTNIPNKEGIEAVETTLKRKNIGTRIILRFLRLVLTLNNFVFNSQNYLQSKGCTMGTCAPSYANIYIYPLIEKISNFYLRFIDDNFSNMDWNNRPANEDLNNKLRESIHL